MPIERTKRSIAAAPVTERADSGQAINALVAGSPRRSVGAFALRSVGRAFGRVMKAGDTRSARQAMTLARRPLSTVWVASVSDAGRQTGDASTLTISTPPRNCARGIDNTRPASVSNYGNARWTTCKCCALTAIASKLGKIAASDIACERIDNAYRQQRMFE